MMCASGLAKLIEECGELQQVCGKKLAYFTTNEHPDGGAPLDHRLRDEMADVMAACWFVAAQLNISASEVTERIHRKVRQFDEWHRLKGNNEHGVDAPRRTR